MKTLYLINNAPKSQIPKNYLILVVKFSAIVSWNVSFDRNEIDMAKIYVGDDFQKYLPTINLILFITTSDFQKGDEKVY